MENIFPYSTLVIAHSNLRRAMEGGHLNGMFDMFVGDDSFHLRLDLQKPSSHTELDFDQKVYNYCFLKAATSC